jgi:DNA (cytosine-5)-methyltransferase 1
VTADLWALADRPPPPLIPGQLAVPDGPAIGSVCTGYGGLDMAVRQVLGGHLAWVADPDPGAAAILTHHHPEVPNLGDITAVDWATVPPVDILTGGYPCQPFSVAGQRKGTADARHIWPFIATALRILRPRLVVLENVANHLRIGFGAVLGDLAALGFDAEWCLVRASEVGAPHRRERLFVLAWPADTGRPGLAWGRAARATADGGSAAADTSNGGLRPGPGLRTGEPCRVGRGRLGDHARPAAADSDRDGREEQQRRESGMGSRGDADGRRPAAAADAEGQRRGEGRPEPAGQQRGSDAALGRRSDWGPYAPAIARWEAVTGRPAPWATDARGRLAPEFVEWDMGLPAGHVTAVPDLSRTRQLKALGNGVVPRQGAAALRLLLDRAAVTT